MVTNHPRHYPCLHHRYLSDGSNGSSFLFITELDQQPHAQHQMSHRQLSFAKLIWSSRKRSSHPLPLVHRLQQQSLLKGEEERVLVPLSTNCCSTLGRMIVKPGDLIHHLRNNSSNGDSSLNDSKVIDMANPKGSLIGYLYEKEEEEEKEEKKEQKAEHQHQHEDPRRVLKYPGKSSNCLLQSASSAHGSFTLDYEETLFRHARFLTPPLSTTSVRMIADIRITRCGSGDGNDAANGQFPSLITSSSRHRVPFIAHNQHNMWIGCVHGMDQIKFGHKLQVCLYHLQDHQGEEQEEGEEDYHNNSGGANSIGGIVSIGKPICLTIAKDRIDRWQETVIRHVYYDPQDRLQRGLQIPLRLITPSPLTPPSPPLTSQTTIKRTPTTNGESFFWNGSMRLVFSMTEDSHDISTGGTSSSSCRQSPMSYTRYAHGHPLSSTNNSTTTSKRPHPKLKYHCQHQRKDNNDLVMVEKEEDMPSESITDELSACPLMLVETHR